MQKIEESNFFRLITIEYFPLKKANVPKGCHVEF